MCAVHISIFAACRENSVLDIESDLSIREDQEVSHGKWRILLNEGERISFMHAIVGIAVEIRRGGGPIQKILLLKHVSILRSGTSNFPSITQVVTLLPQAAASYRRNNFRCRIKLALSTETEGLVSSVYS